MRIFARLFLLLSLIFVIGCSGNYKKPPDPRFVPADFVSWQLVDNRAIWLSFISRKPILIYFYINGHQLCEQMSEQIFTSKNIVLTINNYFLPVRIKGNSTRGRKLLKELDVSAPAVVILSHVDKSVLLRITEVPLPADFLDFLEIALHMDNIKAIQGVEAK